MPNLAPTQQVALIDISLPDWQTLVAGLPIGMAVQTFGSLEQLAQWGVAHQGEYAAVHLLSHGTSGTLKLGGDLLDSTRLNDAQIQTQLQDLGKALTPDGDLLLYGCNVANGQTGTSFIGKLAQITHADVAASNNLTGNAALGGDWVLEAHSGSVKSLELTLNEYRGTLAVTLSDNFVTGLDYPTDLTVDSQNNLYVVSGNDNKLYKFAASGGAITGGAAGIAFISESTIGCVAIDTTGNLYAGTGSAVSSIIKYPSSGGIPSDSGKITFATGFNIVSDIVVGADGYLYIADSGEGKVYKFPSTGSALTPANAISSATVSGAQQIYIDAANNLYATSSGTNKVIKFSASGGAVSLGNPSDFITGSTSFAPYSITSDGTNFYVSSGDFADGELYKFDANGGVANLANLEHTFPASAPTELFWAGNNTLYAPLANNTVSKINPSATSNHAPTISNGTSLATITEDVLSLAHETANPYPNFGDDISVLLGTVGFIDADSDSSKGVVIVGDASTSAQGKWQYSTDTNVEYWRDIGSVSTTAGLVLSFAHFLRFAPAANFSGTPGGLTVHAIDSSTAGSALVEPTTTSWDGTTEFRQTFNTTTDDNATSPVSAGSVTWNVSVTAENDTPTDIALSPSSVAENTSTASALTVGGLTTTDPDTGDTFTYAIQGGADQTSFQISGSNLQFKAGTTLDYETKNSYAVTVRVTDAGGLNYDEALTVNLTNVNEKPVLTAPASQSVTQATATAITGISVADPDSGSNVC